MPQTLGDQPIEQKYSDKMNALAQVLDGIFNGELRGFERKVGFCLWVFSFGDGPARCNYISNADRSDVHTLLKEQLKRWDADAQAEGKDESAA